MQPSLMERYQALSPAQKAEVDALIAADIRDNPWVPLVDVNDPDKMTPQRAAYESLADFTLYGGAAGGGKALGLNELLPTPSGWVTVRDVAVGDSLLDECGNVCSVLAISEQQSTAPYRLTFDDGATIDACADHRWLTFTAAELGALTRRDPEWRAARRKRRKSRALGKKSERFREAISARNALHRPETLPAPVGAMRTTREIAETLRTESGRANHAVPVAGALELPDIDLPIDPYVLGVWLGDGTSANGGVTGIDDEIWRHVEAAGYVVSHSPRDRMHHCILGLKPRLRDLGVLRNKHVPAVYLRASREQRLALLQGLCDTDGCIAADGGSDFNNTNRRLIDAAYELAVSLGIKATITEARATLYGKDCGPTWRVKMTTTVPIFRLSRKLARLPQRVRRTQRFRYIVGCERIAPQPMKCVAIDSPSRLYLAGRAMVPTHNSDLLIGLASTRHHRSIIFRREGTQLRALIDRASDIIGREHFNGQWNHFRLKNRLIRFGGMKDAGSEKAYQGQPHDLMGFDEVTEFLEAQFRFVVAWNRTTVEGQRCRVVAASNPPTTAEGEWIIRFWAPWLDPHHPNPAMPGELRWFVMTEDGDREVDGPEPVEINGELVIPRSRTFIPSSVEDNPFLMATGYKAQLQALPEPLRSQMLRGDFTAGRDDNPWQVIPTAWVRAAQERWTPHRPPGPMTGLGVDVAMGGAAETVMYPRYGDWYGEAIVHAGKSTPDSETTAGLVVGQLRDGAPAMIDVIGPGGEVYGHLHGNNVNVVRMPGGEPSVATTLDGKLRFYNKRAEWWWRMREALDPMAPFPMALPQSSQLRADLCAPRWKLQRDAIKIEEKAEIIKRLGRSPDHGDAAVYALHDAPRKGPMAGTRPLPTRANSSYSPSRGLPGRR